MSNYLVSLLNFPSTINLFSVSEHPTAVRTSLKIGGTELNVEQWNSVEKVSAWWLRAKGEFSCRDVAF